MKKNIILFCFIIVRTLCYCQVVIPQSEVSIFKKDTLVWVEKYKSLLLCHHKGKRECILSVKTKYVFKIDTIQLAIIEDDKNLGNMGNTRVILNSEYCSFVDLDPFNCYFYIFKRHKKNFFTQSRWEELATMVLAPVKSGLSGRVNSPNVDIIDKFFLNDVFTSFSIYTNGKEETHFYDEKLKAFIKKSNTILKK